MDAFKLVLPQNDDPEGRGDRQKALAQQQSRYRFDYHTTTLAGLPMAATPIPVELSLVWVAQVAGVALSLGENLVNLVLPNVVDFDLKISFSVGTDANGALTATGPSAAAHDRHAITGGSRDALREQRSSGLAADAALFKRELDDARARLGGIATGGRTSSSPPEPDRAPVLGGLVALVDNRGGPSIEGAIADAIEGAIERSVLGWLEQLVDKIAVFLGKLLGVYGRPTDLVDYQRQFRTLPLPWPVGVYQTDDVFARMRVAGPNPVVIRRADQADLSGIALGEHAADVQAALGRGGLYVADYSVLQALEPGTIPAQKYVFTPRAWFEVPVAGLRSLRPVAIQPSAGAALVFPGDGTPWEIAKTIVNMADGNYHELISHLGLTHLLTEPFVITTYRQLDPRHPLFVLLAPHFAGTLLINYAAQTQLLGDRGAVDKLLTGTIASSRGVSAQAVKHVRYNQTFLPLTLVERGVDRVEDLPDYPYRDDALALWHAIHRWVTAYLQIYYPTPDDVIGDYELQAWVVELASPQGGNVQDIGDRQVDGRPRIETTEYLAKLLTQVIFTASVQHAAVNFPQRTIMSYTPAMPLAAYAAFPAPTGAPATQILDLMPPLQMGLLQQVVGTALGSVHHTVLGQYGGELAILQVGDALQAFQRDLQRIEVEIQSKTSLGTRTPYTTLLPSTIPQSINI